MRLTQQKDIVKKYYYTVYIDKSKDLFNPMRNNPNGPNGLFIPYNLWPDVLIHGTGQELGKSVTIPPL